MAEPKLEAPVSLPARFVIETKWLYTALTLVGVFIGWLLSAGMTFSAWKASMNAISTANAQEISALKVERKLNLEDYTQFKLLMKDEFGKVHSETSAMNAKLDILLTERKK